jgi:cellulose synthase/poly-beta-1,6-N-acetylglucosamine synthase-like glycosyltransferase
MLLKVHDRKQDQAIKIFGKFEFDLPEVTILLPVYREEVTLPYLLRSISQLDYPKSKLDIRIVVEPDDYPTLNCIFSLPQSTSDNRILYDEGNLPNQIKIWEGMEVKIDYIFLKQKNSRAKPKSLNVGLKKARGNFIIVYDAEDRPEPNQLRKMVAYLSDNPTVTCIQACLGYYNSEQSILTKLFSIEYMYHFHVLLPLLYSKGKVLLLGGTSNFIRTETLRQLSGWDEKNVTEDADLGIRLARKGHVTVPIETTTWEEAPPRLYPWLRQRVRWNKGYLYTLFTHFKRPLSLFNEIGFKAMVLLFYQLSGPLINLIAFVGWILFFFLWVGAFGFSIPPIYDLIEQSYQREVFLIYTSFFTLTFSIFFTVLINAIAIRRVGGKYAENKMRYIPLLLFYNILVGFAGLVAIVEMLVRPQVWHKTYHGFSVPLNRLNETYLES